LSVSQVLSKLNRRFNEKWVNFNVLAINTTVSTVLSTLASARENPLENKSTEFDTSRELMIENVV
jgi:hypothetical protein